jgi:hypothetical protein
MKEAAKKAIIRLIEDAENDQFYGEIVFKIKDGKIYHILKSQSLKLEDLES